MLAISNDALFDTGTARFLRYRLALPLKLRFFIALPILVVAPILIVLKTHQYFDVSVVASIGLGLMLLLYMSDRGYRVAWNEENIYMRERGFEGFSFKRKPFRTISIVDISSMEMRIQGGLQGAIAILPTYLNIKSKNGDDIYLYPPSFNNDDLDELLIHLQKRRPDVFPKAAARWLEIT